MALAKRTRKRKANKKLTLIGCQACARQSSRYWTWINSPGPGNKSTRQHGSHPCSPDTDSEAGYLASIRGPWLCWERVCGLWVAVLVHTSPLGLPSVRGAGAGPGGGFGLPILFDLWESVLRRKSREEERSVWERVILFALVCSIGRVDVPWMSPWRKRMWLLSY